MMHQQTMPRRRDGLLFLCDGSATQSQMAEAFARYIGPSELRYYSACIAPSAMRPEAVRAMRELGIDISRYPVVQLDEIPLDTVATIVTLCADEACPALPQGVAHLSWPMPDPADQVQDEEDLLQGFRRVRDLIRELVSRMF
jgi:arsenate reductase